MYIDLDKQSVIEYVRSKTAFFAPDAVLHSYEFGEGEEDGDGFINFVYRVWEEGGKSVIVKQAKDRYRRFGENLDTPFVQERNVTEALLMKIKHEIVPDYIPEIYYIDRENHAYICEDAGTDLKILRYETMKGKTYKNVGARLGEFTARCNFYTSEIYLEPDKHQELEAAFINTDQRKIFQTGLFLKDESAVQLKEGAESTEEEDPIRTAMGELSWNNRAFRIEMLKLRHVHMKKPECLVHGDLHTSNVLLNDDRMKIIDAEYSYMGPLSGDSGYLLGSMLYEYIRWFYLPEYGEEKCGEMRMYALEMMHDYLSSYLENYKACWDADARSTYRAYGEYRDYVCDTWFHEVMGFAGCQIFSRVGKQVPLDDLETIPNMADQYEACRIALLLSDYLIMNREDINSPDDFVERIVRLTNQYREIFAAAK